MWETLSYPASPPLQPRAIPCKSFRLKAHDRHVLRAVSAADERSNQSPMQQRVLSRFLQLSSTPYSSYIPVPTTVLHRVDARIKQAGIVMVLFVLPGGSATKHVFIGLTLLSLTLLNLPKKTSRAQLIPLLTVTMITFLLTCLFADGTPPPTVSHVPPAAIDNLPALSTSKSYSYTIFKFWFLTITRKSVRIATSTATLLFVALQSASLCLVTTPPEELAVSVQWFLAPLKWVGIPVKQIGFTLLLSLRFLSVVFDEIRNLALGIAVRGLDWNTLGPIGTIQVLMTAINQLFVKLFRTCENVAIAMRLRGFVGPEKHHLYLLGSNHTNWLANIMAIAIIGIVIFVSKRV